MAIVAEQENNIFRKSSGMCKKNKEKSSIAMWMELNPTPSSVIGLSTRVILWLVLGD